MLIHYHVVMRIIAKLVIAVIGLIVPYVVFKIVHINVIGVIRFLDGTKANPHIIECTIRREKIDRIPTFILFLGLSLVDTLEVLPSAVVMSDFVSHGQATSFKSCSAITS